MRYISIRGFVFAIITISCVSVYATPFTPLEWQQKIEKHPNEPFIGQRKHTTWVRDKNRNFIDDVIEKRLKKLREFDIVVDLNSYLTPLEIEKKFDGFGKVKYIGKTITYVFLNHVRAEKLEIIAKMPEVSMIEIQEDAQPALDISARAIQSRTSQTYTPQTAEDENFSGSGINIAIIDTGVDDDHEQLINKRIGGFDATIYEDTNSNGIDDSCEPAPLGNGTCLDPDDEPGDGLTNPDDDWCKSEIGHGTLVAGIALGKGVPGKSCRTPPDETAKCAGVAPEAGLIDIKVCYKEDDETRCRARCTKLDMAEALDWLNLNHEKFKIRVANMSLTYRSDDDGLDDDGTSAIPQQVNYLTALGIVMVAAHGNSSGTPFIAGTQLTQSPGSASFAVTVSGTNDKNNISRSYDEIWEHGYLVGPRSDFDPLSPNMLALKPDISAPAVDVWSSRYNSTDQYAQGTGTSLAAPHVSGAVAIILEANKKMNPGDVKDTLKRSADISINSAHNAGIDPNWDNAFGSGMLNVWDAIHGISSTDVGFPTCSGPANNPGRPCALSGGLPFWNNNQDIAILAPPQVGVANEILAAVENLGPNNATFLVNFGVYVFAVGNNQFFHIGTKQVSVDAGFTEIVSHPWTPASSDHQCVQVSVDYGFDTNFDNNITQRNFSVSPSVFTMRVENPFTVPATFRIEPKSLRDGWNCRIQEYNFNLHPFLDPPRNVQITFDPPKAAKVGEQANCDVAVFAKLKGEEKETLIGGVTVQTFVPKPCRIIGWIRDQAGKAIPGAEVIGGSEQQPIKAMSDKYGFVSLESIPYRPQLITVITKKYGRQSTKARLFCGAGAFEIFATEKGLTIETQQRRKDWAWDLQLRDGHQPKKRSK